LRSVRRFSISAGIREEVYGAHQVVTSPSLSGAAWFAGRFKLRASASRGFRLPSYTDLYYASPSTVGNPNLRPESATSYEGGVDAYLKPNLHLSFTGFERRDTNVVDYVETPGTLNYVAQNLPQLHFMGVEASMVWVPKPGQSINLSFSALHGAYATPQNIVTEYTFIYPAHDAVVEWRGTVAKRVVARTRIGVLNRVGMAPYAVWDASAGYATGRVRPFLQLTNITSTVYQEVPLIAMPKRGVIGGVELWVFGGSR
jgi:outer membrane receptor protein involved in Fe transport